MSAWKDKEPWTTSLVADQVYVTAESPSFCADNRPYVFVPGRPYWCALPPVAPLLRRDPGTMKAVIERWALRCSVALREGWAIVYALPPGHAFEKPQRAR